MACVGHDVPMCRRVGPIRAMIPFLDGNRLQKRSLDAAKMATNIDKRPHCRQTVEQLIAGQLNEISARVRQWVGAGSKGGWIKKNAGVKSASHAADGMRSSRLNHQGLRGAWREV
jgi:F420-0:gamma-glutamyl ligase